MIFAFAGAPVSCSKSESSTANSAISSNTGASTAVASKTTKADRVAMKMSKKCESTNLHQSICMVELMLEDVTQNYDGVDGNIAEIKTLSPYSYQVTIPQDERADIYTYEFEVKKDGIVSMISKKESAKSY
jgi:hypothetical protein